MLGLAGLIISNFETKQVNHNKFSCTSLSQRGSHEELFCYARYRAVFDLTEEWVADSSCEDISWGGCFIENVFYDEKYITEEENKTEGIGCSVKKVRRFKGIDRGYTKINTEGSCDGFDKTYRILIY